MGCVKILTVIGLLGSITWAIADPGFEPCLAVVGALSALVTAFFVDKRSVRTQQYQSISQSSVGIQSGGNVSISNTGSNKNAE